MKQVAIFLMFWFCLSGSYGQDDLSYEVNSIFPSYLLENVLREEHAFDDNGFIWNCCSIGIQCFDGEKLITYNDKFEAGDLSITREGHGYLLGTMVEKRYYWAIEKITSHLICFDTESRRLIKRFVPPEGKFFNLIRKDENEKLFVTCTTKEHIGTRVYKIENLDTTSQFYHSEPSRFYDYAIHRDNHWVRFKDNITVFDSLGELKKIYPTEETACVYFSKSPQERLVLYNECFTQAKVYDPLLDSLRQIYLPEEVKKAQYNIFHFGDQIWFIGQQVGAVLWDEASNTIEDYTETIIEHYKKKESVTPTHRISKVVSDENGGYYIFSQDFILHLTLKSRGVEEYLVPIEIDRPSLSMRATTEDSKGNLYTSFYTGVAVREKDSNTFVDFRNSNDASKAKEATYSLTSWKDKLIWNNIIFDLQSKEQTFIKSPDYGVHLNHALRGDTLWTFWWLSNSLVKTDLISGQSIIVNEKILERPLWASSFQYDEERDLFWISTFNSGIISMDNQGTIKNHFLRLKLGNDNDQRMLHEMYQKDSLIWYGTNSSLGVINIKSEECSHYQIDYTQSNGKTFPRSIFAIFPKNDSILYLGTNKGIVKFNTHSRTMQALKSGHPLEELEFNRNALFQASDGKYYFGTIDGLYSFLEEDLEFEENKIVLKPRIFEIRVVSNDSKQERVISSDFSSIYDLDLRPDESFITIGLTSPSYEKQAGYSYQFANLQRDWINTGSSITIPSLQAGKDTLRIKNVEEGNQTNTSLVQINIHKEQFWYKKNWVIGVFIFGLIGLITFVQRWVYGQKLEREKELASLRTKISSDLHDDVGSILSGLAMQSEMLTYQVDEGKKKELNEISSMSRDAMERMRDTVWSIDSRKDKYENLIDRMRSFAEKTLGRKGIDHEFIVNGIDGKKSITPTYRQNIYLIFKEAITNIVKHSNARKVDIKFYQEEGAIHLVISDNGEVLITDNQVSSDGLGMSNMQLRADTIDAVLKIDQEDGFKVLLSFKH